MRRRCSDSLHVAITDRRPWLEKRSLKNLVQRIVAREVICRIATGGHRRVVQFAHTQDPDRDRNHLAPPSTPASSTSSECARALGVGLQRIIITAAMCIVYSFSSQQFAPPYDFLCSLAPLRRWSSPRVARRGWPGMMCPRMDRRFLDADSITPARSRGPGAISRVARDVPCLLRCPVSGLRILRIVDSDDGCSNRLRFSRQRACSIAPA